MHYDRFLEEYSASIVDSFDAYYAIGFQGSKVTAQQFKRFCANVGAPLFKAGDPVKALFNDSLIEEVFRVKECVFDAVLLKQLLKERLRTAGVHVLLGAEALRVRQMAHGLSCEFKWNTQVDEIRAAEIYNCTYSEPNAFLRASGLPQIPLKHEWTEMALVKVPPPFQSMAITVMCGPFFSLMPFPSRALHTLSHVRYTPHEEWFEGDSKENSPTQAHPRPQVSRFAAMIRDASRYLPALREVVYVESIWQIKTLLPLSEVDDSRPILHMRNHGLPGLHVIIGGKLDNVYDIIDEISMPDTSEFP
jgi:glycine/D-amino acid oxidase-like deaminating enzyme